MYPRAAVDLNKIAHNVRHMKALCASYGIEILGVTKVFAGERCIAETMVNNGLQILGDSRIANIQKYADLPCRKCLIRMPMQSEADAVVKWCDLSLNSEVETLRALDEAAVSQGKVHGVILMVDLGDLREGCFEEEDLARCAAYAQEAKGLTLYGLGTNLTCFSFVQPDTEKLTRLTNLAEKYGAAAYVSGGNSATLQLMLRGGVPKGITALRLGESVLFGRERAGYTYLDGMYNDAFTIEAQIVECKVKPSMPIGTIGKNSYGVRPEFTDRGKRTRAILAMGRQDIDSETMWPIDNGIEILGASSDHFIVDITDAEQEYHIGDTMKFRLGYFSTMRVFTSSYVEKVFIS